MPVNPDENFETAMEDEASGGADFAEEEDPKRSSEGKGKKNPDSHSLKSKENKLRTSVQGQDKTDPTLASDQASQGSKKVSVVAEDSLLKGRQSATGSLPGEGDTTVIPVAVQPVFPPPWPEWSDGFINQEETWDVDSGIAYFEDVFAATDFLGVKAYHWLRPREFLQEPPSVVKLSSTTIDIITPNAHLCEKSEVLRYILSEISELYDYSIQNKFVECEGEGTVYVPNYAEEDRKWTPWSHIYSCCKAGVRGERPIYNPKGKYYVRLYFLGAWRRILVDDRIPVLPTGQSGLPLTALNELWPLLLTKALLKVATVTWRGEDVKKFSAISALTGWIFEWIDNIDGVNENDLWSDLQNTLPKYLDPKRIPSCYTLLHAAQRTHKFGNMGDVDTFWWMPSIVVHPSENEDAALKSIAEEQPFELDTRDILGASVLRNVSGQGGEVGDLMQPVTLMEVKWVRKTVKEDPAASRKPTKTGIPKSSALDVASLKTFLEPNNTTVGGAEETGGGEEETADKTGEVPSNLNIDATAVAKKKKKKTGGGIGDDIKSEKKSNIKKNTSKKMKDTEAGGRSKQDVKKKSKTIVIDVQPPDDTAEVTEDEEIKDDAKKVDFPRSKMKLKGLKHWSTLKDVVLGDAATQIEMRKSKSARHSYMEHHDANVADGGKSNRASHHKHRIKRQQLQEDGEELDTMNYTPGVKKDQGLPSVAEILYGVEKYAGIDYRNIVKNWENICGKDSPITLTVVLKKFPRSEEEDVMAEGEDNGTFVPAFLQHPIQLTQVRDTVLQKLTDRPTTPLWKRFRWKKWAMKKGLIPLEEDRSKEVIRAVMVKTPFVFKSDWYDFTQDNVDYVEEGEMDEVEGEDDDDDGNVTNFFLNFNKESKNKSKEGEGLVPGVPPPVAIGVERRSRGQSLTPTGVLPKTPSTAGILPSVQRNSKEEPQSGRLPSIALPQDNLALPERDNAAEPKSKTPRKRSSDRSKAQLTLPPKKSPRKSKSSTSSKKKPGSSKAVGVQEAEGGAVPRRSQAMMVLHDSEMVMGESEEEFDEGFKRKMLVGQTKVFPTTAAASLWFSCDEIAKNLRKFCKFYTSQSIFGSCYILRREPTSSRDKLTKLSPLFWDLHKEPGFPEYPMALTGYRQKEEGLNVAVKFDRYTNYHVTDYLMDKREGINSAFYLCNKLSDCWTEQELIITVHVLQEDYIKQYNDATAAPLAEEIPGPPPTAIMAGSSQPPHSLPKPTDLPLVLVMEPWDWRQDNSVTTPLLICTKVNDRWISHVNLPAGRNTFRLWLFYEEENGPKDKGNNRGIRFLRRSPPADPEEEAKLRQEFLRKKDAISFSARIVSQTPIYVGSRAQVQNYMTNPPMLLLKQSERLAHCLWGLFACFGKKRPVYQENLRQLRKSYCPAYSQPNLINRYVRAAHDTFEELFVSLVAQYNDGKLDNMLVLTLRVLFLNPMIGRQFLPYMYRENEDTKMVLDIFRGLRKKARSMLTNAAIVIQRFYRGWRVRHLFHLRRRSHRDFKKIEYNVRRIAFLLAKETDSVFSQIEMATMEKGGGQGSGETGALPDTPLVEDNFTLDPEKVPPTMLPSPPHWAVALLNYVLDRHTWLITVYPHAQCEPHHVKVQELQGELPQRIKDFSWYPFFRQVLKVTPNSKSCFLELDLQVYPPLGVHLKIINNDTGNFLKTVNNRLFIGRLFENKYGYTIFCYRWAASTLNQELNDRPPSTVWRLRLVTPHDQDGPRFQHREEFLSQVVSGESFGEERNGSIGEETPLRKSLESEGSAGGKGNRGSVLSPNGLPPEEIPSKLCLRRLTGYYTPNKDLSVCQYLLETDDKRATISLRFMASNIRVRLRVLVWDCFRKTTVFDEICKGGLIAPSIQLHVAKHKSKNMSSESLKEGSVESLSGEISPEEDEEKIRSPFSAKLEENAQEKPLEVVMGATGNSNASSKVSVEDEEHRRESSVGSHDKIGKDQSDELLGSGVAQKKRAVNKHRYIISVYVLDDTWPLSDRELLYVLYRERKFFKTIKTQHCTQLAKMKEEEEKKKAAELAAQQAVAAAEAAELSATEEAKGPEVKVTPDTDDKKELLEEKVEPVKKEQPGGPLGKKKGKKKEGGGGGGGAQTESNPSAPPTPAIQQPVDTPVYPSTPPPTNVSAVTDGDDTAKSARQTKVGEKVGDPVPVNDFGKIKRRLNGNLYIKYGGHQCQSVKHLDQPHWYMEIVTESRVKYKLKSNWEILRKRLVQARESWESGGVELLYQDLSTRLDYLLENMVEDNFLRGAHHKFVMVDPMAILFKSWHLDDYDLKEFANHELVRLLIGVWSMDQEENKKAGERFLKNRKRKATELEEGKNIKAPKPDQLLDYIPPSLRKLAEKFQRRLEEREQHRLNIIKGPSEEADLQENEEEEVEDEITEVVGASSAHSGGLRSSPDNQPSYGLNQSGGEGVEGQKSQLALPGGARSPRKTTADGRTERSMMKKGKKVGPAVPKLPAESTKPGGKRTKNDQEKGNSSLKDKESGGKNAPAADSKAFQEENEEGKLRDGQGKMSGSGEETKEDYVTECARIRLFEKIGEMIRLYENFFKEPNSIRQSLDKVMTVEALGKLRRDRLESAGEEPKKLLLAKTGISKYGEKREEIDKEEEGNIPSEEDKASMVAKKLLRWAYDYSFLPPTEEIVGEIEDPGELPVFLMRVIMEGLREEERLEEERLAALALAAEHEGENDE